MCDLALFEFIYSKFKKVYTLHYYHIQRTYSNINNPDRNTVQLCHYAIPNCYIAILN